MEITRTALITVGCIAIVLFFSLLLHLAIKLYRQYVQRRTGGKYQLLTDESKTAERKSSENAVRSKVSVLFPTSTLPVQLGHEEMDGILESNGAQESTGRQGLENLPKERGRKCGSINKKNSINDLQNRRKERIFSVPELYSLRGGTSRETERRKSKQRCVKSEQEMETLMQPQRERARSTLQVVPEMSGLVEYSVFINGIKNTAEIKINQIIDVNEISPELFHDRFPTFHIDEVPWNAEKPHLLRHESQQLVFSDPKQLGFCIELMKFPNKEHICTTDYKFGMHNTLFDEAFTTEFKNLAQLQGSTVRLQVLLRYGDQPQRPVIVGESLLPLSKCEHGVHNLFRDALKYPMDEKKLESMAMEHAGIGNVVISVRYQLLQQHLTVRIVEAFYNDRLGIQLPSTSIKVGVYHFDNKIDKNVTDVKKKTLNPQFQESFDFPLPLDKLEKTGILLEVQHHGHMQKSIVGYVHIGLKAGRKGRDYWRKVVGFSDFNTMCVLEIQTIKPRKIC